MFMFYSKRGVQNTLSKDSHMRPGHTPLNTLLTGYIAYSPGTFYPGSLCRRKTILHLRYSCLLQEVSVYIRTRPIVMIYIQLLCLTLLVIRNKLILLQFKLQIMSAPKGVV